MATKHDERRIVFMRCMKCGAKDQAAVPLHTPTIRLDWCRKCQTWNWEFGGPDLFGALTEDKDQITKQIKKANPQLMIKSELWRMFCKALDSGRVQDGTGNFAHEWCTSCVNEPHLRVGGHEDICTCGCHVAWAFRESLERETEEPPLSAEPPEAPPEAEPAEAVESAV